MPRDNFPRSFARVFISPGDFAGAREKNLKRLGGDGLFALKDAARPGVIESAAIKTLFPFNSLILSANADLNPGDTLQMEGKTGWAQNRGVRWGGWLKLGRFSPDSRLSGSFGGQPDVDVDQIKLSEKANVYKYRIILKSGGAGRPVLRLAAAVYADLTRPPAPSGGPGAAAAGCTLKVPPRSQLAEPAPENRRICSPAAVGMALEYWGAKIKTPAIARGVYDSSAGIYGNWFLNTAYAGSKGFYSFVTRYNSLTEAEAEIAKGRPVIASLAYKKGRLAGAPIAETKGHLVIIKGFAKNGDVIVNDPAAPSAKSAERRYKRGEFAAAWINNKAGLAYSISPRFPQTMAANSPIVDIRRKPGSSSTLDTQLLAGEKALLARLKNGWARILCVEQRKTGQRSGYPGWARFDQLTWAHSIAPGAVAAAPTVKISAAGRFKALYMGSALPAFESGKKSATALLPDGASTGLKKSDILPVCPGITVAQARQLIPRYAMRLNNSKYLWGGRTARGIDCSGLVKLAYALCGINLPRDAADQFSVSNPIASGDKLERGDVIFTAPAKQPARITHVMLYAGGGLIIEAARAPGRVRRAAFYKKFKKFLAQTENGGRINGRIIYFASFF